MVWSRNLQSYNYYIASIPSTSYNYFLCSIIQRLFKCYIENSNYNINHDHAALAEILTLADMNSISAVYIRGSTRTCLGLLSAAANLF